jgi:DNA-directed RNA polymerase I, II, and III subunit RPABC1
MLSRRGYVTGSASDLTLSAFVDKFGQVPDRSSLTIVVSSDTGEESEGAGDRIIVFFPEDEKVGVKPIKIYTDQMREMQISRAILVLRQGITPHAKQGVSELSDEFSIEHFREAELLVDITEHHLVPEHIVLNSAEKKDLLERYRLKEFQLPRIQPTDPVARYFGMKRGQIVKIIRPSETAGRYVTYRICI